MGPWGVEGARGEGSDVRTVTVTLGTGNFRFDYVKIVDVNNAERNMFGVGESVYYSCRFTNRGTTKDTCIFTIKDLDTGAVIKSDEYPNMEPLASGTFAKQKLGVMPDKNWRVEFKVVP